jgi:Fe-S cluster assembly iron-binding protein IscA
MITMTERAAAKVRELLDREANESAALRLRVTGGGCSGLRYELAFDHVTLWSKVRPAIAVRGHRDRAPQKAKPR